MMARRWPAAAAARLPALAAVAAWASNASQGAAIHGPFLLDGCLAKLPDNVGKPPQKFRVGRAIGTRRTGRVRSGGRRAQADRCRRSACTKTAASAPRQPGSRHRKQRMAKSRQSHGRQRGHAQQRPQPWIDGPNVRPDRRRIDAAASAACGTCGPTTRTTTAVMLSGPPRRQANSIRA